jgi:uncharacterized membrane protein YdbT with pleckstrin-like domain
MSYVSHTLGANERILFLTGYHGFYWAGGIILTTPFIAVALGRIPYNGLDYFLLALAAVPLFFGLRILIRAYALELAVTSDRFVKKTGLISITTEEVSLDKIEEVNVNETILGRIFGYGTINVHGTGAGDIRMNWVRDPIRLRREIQTAREHIKGKGE